MNRYTRWRLNQAEQPTLTAGRAATVVAVLSVAGFAAITAALPLPFEQYISGVAIYAFALVGGIFTGMIAARELDPCTCDDGIKGQRCRCYRTDKHEWCRCACGNFWRRGFVEPRHSADEGDRP